MAASFEFPVRICSLPRLDALRIGVGSDYWPEAAFRVFRSARNSCFLTGYNFSIPENIFQRTQLAAFKSKRPRHYSGQINLYQEKADPVVVEFLNRLAEAFEFHNARFAALALVDTWAANPNCWPGAPKIRK